VRVVNNAVDMVVKPSSKEKFKHWLCWIEHISLVENEVEHPYPTNGVQRAPQRGTSNAPHGPLVEICQI